MQFIHEGAVSASQPFRSRWAEFQGSDKLHDDVPLEQLWSALLPASSKRLDLGILALFDHPNCCPKLVNIISAEG
jgi:hypothetical protein